MYMYKYVHVHITYNNTYNCALYHIIQVCIPGLHISLGIFNRFYNLLENACHELDLLQAETDTGAESQAGTSFGRYSAALRKLTELQHLHDTTEEACKNGEQLLLYLTLHLPDAAKDRQGLAC